MIDLCPAFRGLTLEARHALSRCCDKAEFFADQRIVPVTEPLKRIFIIVEGRAKLIGLGGSRPRPFRSGSS